MNCFYPKFNTELNFVKLFKISVLGQQHNQLFLAPIYELSEEDN
jgi:hypothetical protein